MLNKTKLKPPHCYNCKIQNQKIWKKATASKIYPHIISRLCPKCYILKSKKWAKNWRTKPGNIEKGEITRMKSYAKKYNYKLIYNNEQNNKTN